MHTHHTKHAHSTHPAQSGSTGAKTTTQRAASGDKDHTRRVVTADEIRIRAYRKWELAGKPAGDGVRFWLDAERELMGGE